MADNKQALSQVQVLLARGMCAAFVLERIIYPSLPVPDHKQAEFIAIATSGEAVGKQWPVCSECAARLIKGGKHIVTRIPPKLLPK